MTSDGFTPAQASAVSALSLKAVHKLIDGHLIRPRRMRVGGKTQRRLSQEQLVYLGLEAEGVRLLPLAVRREIARMIETSPEVEQLSISEGSALIIRVKPVRRAVKQQLARLKKAQQMAISQKEVMQGTPVYRGTRIPIELVAEMLSGGASIDEILEGYPALAREQVELAPLYVLAFPRRGRPVRRPWAQQKPLRVTRRAGAVTS